MREGGTYPVKLAGVELGRGSMLVVGVPVEAAKHVRFGLRLTLRL